MRSFGSLRLAKQAGLLLAVLALTIALAACGDSGGGDNSTTASTKDAVNHGRYPLPVKGGTYAEEHPGAAAYGSPPLEIEADPSGKLAFTKDEVMAEEGNVAIEFTNPQSTPQNIALEIVGKKGKLVSETISEGFTIMASTLYPSKEYVYFSTLPGHRKAGMEGVIKVTPPKK